MRREKKLTLRDLDLPKPVGMADADHAAEFPDLYLDVEQEFGEKGLETPRYFALRSRVPSRLPGVPDLSGFSPRPAPSIEERAMRIVVSGDHDDALARSWAMQRLDELTQAAKPELDRGQHEGQERLSALRGELILSIYAAAGRTGMTLKALVGLSEIPQWWFDDHKGVAPTELRDESRRTGRMAFFKEGGGFDYRDPLEPTEWDDRWSYIKADEPREGPAR